MQPRNERYETRNENSARHNKESTTPPRTTESNGKRGETETEKDRQRQRQTDRDRDRQRKSQIETETETDRQVDR